VGKRRTIKRKDYRERNEMKNMTKNCMNAFKNPTSSIRNFN
jgi:hypothetical protein